MSERVEPLGEKLKVDGDLLQWLGVGWRKLDDLIADHNRLADQVEAQGEELEAVRARLRMIEEWRTPSAEGEDHLLACKEYGAKVGHLPGCPHHAPRHLLDLDDPRVRAAIDNAASGPVMGAGILDALRPLATEGPRVMAYFEVGVREGRESGYDSARREALAALEEPGLREKVVDEVAKRGGACVVDAPSYGQVADAILAAVRKAIEGGGK